MIIVDANIWIDHFRLTDLHLVHLLRRDRVRIHPFTIGEVGLGSFPDLAALIESLEGVSPAPTAEHDEVMVLIGRHRLPGTGVGYVDSHLLASAKLIGGRVWTRDKRLHAQAERLGIAYLPPDAA